MFTQAWGDFPPEGMVRLRSSWGQTVCRALMGMANKIKISLSIIYKTKRLWDAFLPSLGQRACMQACFVHWGHS